MISGHEEVIIFHEPISIKQDIVSALIEIGSSLKRSIKDSILPCYESMLSRTFVESKFTHQVISGYAFKQP